MTKTKQPTNKRFHISELSEKNDPRFALFLRSPSGKNAKFVALHETLQSAVETARSHAAETAGHGCLDFTYYAVEIKHRVGIEHGKLIDIPTLQNFTIDT